MKHKVFRMSRQGTKSLNDISTRDIVRAAIMWTLEYPQKSKRSLEEMTLFCMDDLHDASFNDDGELVSW